MNRASLVRLAQGLAVQLACYAGLFLALAVAARALSPSEFGTYASAVAVASFAGSVITLGLDRILLRVLIQRGDGSGQAKAALSQSVFVPAVTLNIAILVGVIGLTAIGWVATNQLLIAVMAVMVAGRLILSGWFKFMSNNHANVIATFGLHSLGIGLTFGLIMVINPRSAFITQADCWMVATFVAEGIQLGTLYVLSRRQGFRVSPSHTEPLRNALSHARAGILISLLCLFAQTGLMGITLSRWLLSTVDQGIFTVAYRVSQLILFPLIGASQLIIPLSSRLHAPSEIALVRREIRNLLWSTNGLLVASNIGFAIIGFYLLDVFMHVTDPQAYWCTLILSLGNLITGLFGVGDQIMIAVGRHRQAFWIAFSCGGIVFPVLAVSTLMLGHGVVGLAFATAVAISLRAIIAYWAARRFVDVPVAVFDRV